MLLDDEKIKICNFWLTYPDQLGETPEGLYNQEDVANLLVSIAGSGGLTLDKVESYKIKIESLIIQKESHNIQKKGISYRRDVLLIIITAIVTLIFSNISKIYNFLKNLLLG